MHDVHASEQLLMPWSALEHIGEGVVTATLLAVLIQ
jgi:hypothetical protein